MTDVHRELQKLKALINQKQTTAIFSNKANESTKLALGDVELYINDMTRKFSFTRAGVKNPIAIDPKTKSLENVEYLNGVKVDDITSSTVAIEKLEELTSKHTSEIAECKASIDDIERKDIERDERVTDLEELTTTHTSEIAEQDNRIAAVEADVSELESDVGGYNSRISTVETKVTELEETVGKEHNHDDRYSKLNHTHDTYVNVTTLYNSLKQCAPVDHTHTTFSQTISSTGTLWGSTLKVPTHLEMCPEDSNLKFYVRTSNKKFGVDVYNGSGKIIRGVDLLNGSMTITHYTNVTGEIGTFCESTGDIYDGYEHISHTDCICAVQQSKALNKKIVGIVCSEDEFASHGDVYVRVDDASNLEVGDILCPDANGYGRKATEADLMYMMMYAIPRPKITSLDTAFEGFVACFLV